VSILNPLFDAVAWVIAHIHAALSVPFGASSGWAWGLSIVILVMLMRLIMVPLFIKQVNAQRKMQAHMPQLQELRKRYKNDKQRLNEETMKFYKENGINPLGGCLPLVAQLPLFWALFNVLRGISDWKVGHPAPYGLSTSVVASAKQAHIFGASLADKFLFPVAGEHWAARIVILLFVLISAATTYLTMRQSAKRGMMQQTPMDPDNPAANMQKYMMYIAPFFALSGLYWQFGLVIYWVTTNIWTLGQQHILFRNLPVVGSTPVGAAAAQAVPGTTSAPAKSSAAARSNASGKTAVAGRSTTSSRTSVAGRNGVSGKAGVAGRTSASGKNSVSAKTAGSAKVSVPQDSEPQDTVPQDTVPQDSVPKASAARASTAKASSPKASAPSAPKATSNGSATAGSSEPGGTRGLLRFGKSKAEPEPVPAAPQVKTVRQQPVRQTRSKRSGKG
jgi:YidC/Oxa1 family membrane protein insertase